MSGITSPKHGSTSGPGLGLCRHRQVQVRPQQAHVGPAAVTKTRDRPREDRGRHWRHRHEAGTQEPWELDKAGCPPPSLQNGQPCPHLDFRLWLQTGGQCLWSLACGPRALGVPSGASGLVGSLYFSRGPKAHPPRTGRDAGARLASCQEQLAAPPAPG